MSILKIIEGLLGIVGFLTKQAERRQWMDAGAAEKALNDIHASKKTVKDAGAAARNTRLDADSLRDDPANRD